MKIRKMILINLKLCINLKKGPTIWEKIKYTKEAITTSIHSEFKKYVIDRKTIRILINNIENLKTTENEK